MPKAVVLGCGKVGSVMAMDLAGSDDFEVVGPDENYVYDRLGKHFAFDHSSTEEESKLEELIRLEF